MPRKPKLDAQAPTAPSPFDDRVSLTVRPVRGPDPVVELVREQKKADKIACKRSCNEFGKSLVRVRAGRALMKQGPLTFRELLKAGVTTSFAIFCKAVIAPWFTYNLRTSQYNLTRMGRDDLVESQDGPRDETPPVKTRAFGRGQVRVASRPRANAAKDVTD